MVDAVANGGEPRVPGSGDVTEDPEFESLLRRVAGTPEQSIDTPLLPGTVIDDKLRIEHVIGHGGMGVVYLARHLQLSRDVAVKLTRGGVDELAHARLLREAQAMASITHDNVVTIYDVGTVNDQIFVAMEFIEGGTIRDWLAAQPRSWREILGHYLAAGRGLAAAHERGLVHRDFKPDNILIGDDGRVRVADFGLVHVAGAELDADAMNPTLQEPDLDDPSGLGAPIKRLTTTGTAAGTPAYMALEQFDGRAPDARSDQFSYCVSLYESLYGRRPFPGVFVGDLVNSLTHGGPSEPDDGRRVPAIIRRALLRGLSSDPNARFESMDALLADLGRALTRRGRTVVAGVGLLAIGGTLTWGLVDAAAPKCVDLATLRDIWNDTTRAELRQEVLSSDEANREQVWTTAEEQLDRYVSQWESIYREACVVPPAKRQISLSCLEGRRHTLKEHLAKVDVAASRAGGIVSGGLDSVETCRPIAEVEPATEQGVTESSEARELWGAAVRYYRTGEFDKALATLRLIDFENPAVANTRTHGLALAMMGDVTSGSTRTVEATAYWREAIPILVAVDDIDTATQTTVSLAAALLGDFGSVEEVRLLVDLAEAWLGRAPGRDWLAGKVRLLKARLAIREGDLEQAEALLREGIEMTDVEEAPGPRFDLELDLARLLRRESRFEAARALLDQMYDAQRVAHAADHHNVHAALLHLAAVRLDLGDVTGCRELLSSAPEELAVFSTGYTLVHLRTQVRLLELDGDVVAARDLFKERLFKDPGFSSGGIPGSPFRAELAVWHAKAGEPALAQETLDGARATSAEDKDPSAAVTVEVFAAEVSLALGNLDEAMQQLDAATVELERFPISHPARRRAARLVAAIERVSGSGPGPR